MIKLKCLLVCFACITVTSFASLVPFIDPCEEQDTACLLKSAQKAVPYVADGGFLGLPPLDPMHIDKPVSMSEGGLNIEFNDVVVTGTRGCKVTGLEVSTKNEFLKFSADCPIHVKGKYIASGKVLGVDMEGAGPFFVDADEVHLSIQTTLKIVTGSDGEEHWHISKPEYSYEVRNNAKIHFENLFNGDETRAAPVNNLFEQYPKELIGTFGQGIVKEVIYQALKHFGIMIKKVSRSDLQKI